MLRTDSRVVDTAKFGLRSLSALSAAARLRRGRSPAGTDSQAGEPSVISPSLACATSCVMGPHGGNDLLQNVLCNVHPSGKICPAGQQCQQPDADWLIIINFEAGSPCATVSSLIRIGQRDRRLRWRAPGRGGVGRGFGRARRGRRLPCPMRVHAPPPLAMPHLPTPSGLPARCHWGVQSCTL